MVGYITLAVTILMMFVEITPIKINPISWLIARLNKPTLDRIDNLESQTNKRLDELEKQGDERDIGNIRNRILANESLLRKGEHFKRYQYESLYKDIDRWNEYHRKYPDLNGLLKNAIKFIDECYENETFDENE